MKTLTAAIPFFALVSAIPAFAGVPDAVTYAGTLNQGAAPANGTFTVVLGLFDAAANGNRVFEQTEASLAVSQGELVVDLGADPLNPLSDEILKGGPLFLDIVVNGEELTPRVPFTSVPFARVAKQAEHASKADDADTLGGLAVDDILNVFTAGPGLVRNLDTFSIAPAGVTAANMATGSVNSAAIVDFTIGTADIANNAIDSSKILNDSITSSDIATDGVGSQELRDGGVSTVDMAALAVTTAKLANNAVTAAKVDGIAVYVEPVACGSHLAVKRGNVQLQCETVHCNSTHFANCDGTCTVRTTPTTCDVPEEDANEIGLLIAK